MTTFGVLLFSGVGAAVVGFLIVVARGKRLRAAEENCKKHEAAARLYVESRNKIGDFGAFLEKEPLGPLGIADVARLPYPKDDLIAAFCVVLAVTTEQPLRGQLQAAALYLAQYQPGVGPNLLNPARFPTLEAIHRMTGEELAATVLEGSADAPRWEPLNAQVEEDMKRIALAVGVELQKR